MVTKSLSPSQRVGTRTSSTPITSSFAGAHSVHWETVLEHLGGEKKFHQKWETEEGVETQSASNKWNLSRSHIALPAAHIAYVWSNQTRIRTRRPGVVSEAWILTGTRYDKEAWSALEAN